MLDWYQSFVSAHYLKNRRMEFHQILYVHLYWQDLSWDCYLQICNRVMALDGFYSMKSATAGLNIKAIDSTRNFIKLMRGCCILVLSYCQSAFSCIKLPSMTLDCVCQPVCLTEYLGCIWHSQPDVRKKLTHFQKSIRDRWQLLHIIALWQRVTEGSHWTMKHMVLPTFYEISLFVRLLGWEINGLKNE